MLDDSFELIHQNSADAILRAYNDHNPQVAPDPTGQCWQTQLGGPWHVGARLQLNLERARQIRALPARQHLAEETTTNLPAIQTADLPLVVTVLGLPGRNEHGVFSPLWPMQLKPDDDRPSILLRGGEAQFFYQLETPKA
jgi:hypothetical protein